MLSVVMPSYNEEEMLPRAVQVLSDLLGQEKIEYELIFVDDGSSDRTWQRILAAAEQNSRIHGVHFSRNFGKEAAILAGLAEAKGDCTVVMDCDLQHPPTVIPEMYAKWQNGAQVVEGVKRSRGTESSMHRAAAGMFYKLMSRAAKFDMQRASDFKLLDRQVVEAILSFPERGSFFRALSAWVGYETASVEYDVQEREAGVSKWSTKALIRYAITNILGFSSAPMQFVTGAGLIVFLFAVILGIQTLVRYFTGHAVEGFTTVILLLLFMGSVIMISLGIIGYYISRIYEEVKKRPRYLVSKRI